MGSDGQTGVRLERLKGWLKHPFKSVESKPQGTPAPKNTCDVQVDLSTESAQAPTSQPSAREPEVQDSPEPKDLWQVAHDQLDEAQKDKLAAIKLPGELNENGAPPITEIIDGVVNTTKRQFEEYQNGSLKIPGSAGHQINFRKVFEKILNAALSFKDIGTAVAGLDPTQHASGVWAVVSLGLTMAQNHYASRTAFFQSSEYLTNALARGIFIETEFYRVKTSKGRDGLETAIIQMYKAILLYTVEVRSAQNPSMGRKVMDCVNAMTGQAFKDLQLSLDQEERYLQQWFTMDQHLQRRQEAEAQLAKIDSVLSDLRGLRDESVLARLKSLDDACFDSYQEDGDTMDESEGTCLPGTRTELIEQVTEWATSPDRECIFWLSGMAGTGKSTVSRTLAASFQQTGILGASFFFKRGAGDRAAGKRLFTTIAKQLVTRVPQLIPGITKAIQNDRDISGKSLKVQFENLLQAPLSGIVEQSNYDPRILVIVIDALDECDSKRDIEEILGHLPKLAPAQVRFFLTSRPDVSENLFGEWQGHGRRHLLLHEIPPPIIERDIALFLSSRFMKIREDNKDFIQPDWPGNEVIQKLVTISVPLFVFAATICRFVGEKAFLPQQRLQDFLSHPAMRSGSEMDRTYLPILEQPFRVLRPEEERKTLMNEFHATIGVIILLATPVSITTLSSILGVDKYIIAWRLSSFHSVLDIPGHVESTVPVKTLHLSFRDYLLTTQNEFHIDEEETHEKLASCCLQRMNAQLQQNICQLSSYAIQRENIESEVIDKHITADLQYACRYWVHHLERCKGRVSESEVLRFLKAHFLHWLEVLALIGEISKATGIIEILKSGTWKEMDCELSSFLDEAGKFALQNTYTARVTPLQIYCAGLVFAPTTSIIKTTFHEEMPTQIRKLPMEYFWSPNLHTLEGHTETVDSVAFSPDGYTLASAAGKTIFLWDTATGQQLQELTGQSMSVETVAFSPDGSILASGSYDKTIILWVGATGEQWKTLKGHSDAVTTVAFSPNGSTLASGSHDRSIILWTMATGKQRILGHHASWVSCVAFSVSGQILASGSLDETVILWDIATGQQQHILSGHSSWVSSLAFSPDGIVVASGAYDTIVLWEVATGKRQQTLGGNANCVLSLAFHTVSSILASGQMECKIMLWDVATGKQQRTLTGHGRSVDSLAFSTDGRMLASGSQDTTIKLWDIATYNQHQQQSKSGHTSWIRSMAFSRDGSMLASGSDDCDVLLWDVATGNHQKLSGQPGEVLSVAFSPDGCMLASSSDDTVSLWDTATGERRHTLICDFPGHVITDVAFSPDGRTLASAGRGIILWDTETCQQRRRLDYEDSVWAVVFSPDGCTLASDLGDHTFQLWDTVTGERQQRSTACHSTWRIRSMAFSPDGRTLALHFFDDTLELWDKATDRPQTLNACSDSVLSVNKSHFNRDVWVSGSWVLLRDEPLLLLPPEYSSFSCQTSMGCMLALGYEDGRVIFLVFDA